MADVNGGFIPHDLVKSGVDLILRHRVKSRRGLVQNHKRGVAVQRPGNGDLLCLSAGYLHSFLIQVFIKDGIQSSRPGREPLAKPCFFQALCRFFSVIIPLCLSSIPLHPAGPLVSVRNQKPPSSIGSVPGGHVFSKLHGKKLEILKDHGKDTQIFPVIILPYIDAV